MFTNQINMMNMVSDIGWTAVTTGFSFVLYSRLHLVNPGEKVLRTALTVIIVTATIIHSLVFIGIMYTIFHPTALMWRAFSDLYSAEIVFTVQETALSTCYVYFFIQFTADSRAEQQAKAMTQFLVGAEILVFGTDVILNVLLLKRLYMPRSMIVPFCAISKLRIEFMVLNSMVKYSRSISTRIAMLSWRNQGEGERGGPVEVRQNQHSLEEIAPCEQEARSKGEPGQAQPAVGVGTERTQVEGCIREATSR
jgi:hypothetical protein